MVAMTDLVPLFNCTQPSGTRWSRRRFHGQLQRLSVLPVNRINPDDVRSVEPLKRMNWVVHPPGSTKWGKNRSDAVSS